MSFDVKICLECCRDDVHAPLCQGSVVNGAYAENVPVEFVSGPALIVGLATRLKQTRDRLDSVIERHSLGDWS